MRLVLLSVLLASWLAAGASGVLAGQGHRTADDVTGRINPSGRTLPMTVQLIAYGKKLGDILIWIGADDTISVSRSGLLLLLKSDGSKDTIAALKSLSERPTLADLNAAGLALDFDRQTFQLTLGLKAEQRKLGDISLAYDGLVDSARLEKPAFFSGYINLFAQAGQIWKSDQTALQFDAESVFRIGRVVVENELSLQNDVNARICPVDAFCLFGHESGLRRLGSRAVVDWPDQQVRLTAGDTRVETTSFQRSASIAGVTLEYAPAKLNPGQSMRATGAQSFTLDRPATVEVLINGALAQRLTLAPGNYNLRDLPLRAGANEIVLLITDDTGASRTLTFSSYSSYALLGAGKWEAALSAGVPSYMYDSFVQYVSDRYLASSFVRYGLTQRLTFEAHAQADDNVIMAGAGFVTATPFGIWGAQLAASQTDHDVGFGLAARLTWDLIGQDNASLLRLSAEWHSDDFRAPGLYLSDLGDVHLPIYQFQSSFAASYSRSFGDNWQATLAGRYDIADEAFAQYSRYAQRGDRYHVDLSLSHPLFDNGTITGTVGYSNDSRRRLFLARDLADQSDNEGALWAGLRYFWRPKADTIVMAAGDTASQRSTVSGYRHSGTGIGSWSTNVTATDDRYYDSTRFGANATYHGNRAEVAVSHDSGVAWSGRAANIYGEDQRSRVRVGTSIVFADGHAAISAPVRGNGGFAILYPHESLAERAITAGSVKVPRGQSDAAGPAVVKDLAAYSQQTVAVDVDDLPIGYSLGASGYDLRPPYKAGYALQVGSGYSVTALGTLVDASGVPVGLVAGVVSQGERQIAIFTNQSGKFGIDGLSEGRWVLTMEAEGGPLHYDVIVPKGAVGLVRLGTLVPVKG